MKTTKQVKVPARTVKATVKKVETVYCDICLLKDLKTVARYKCRLCNRDICYNQIDYKGMHTRYDERDPGDYPSRYCTICHELKFTGEFNDLYYELQENLDREEAIIERKIKKLSLATTNSN